MHHHLAVPIPALVRPYLHIPSFIHTHICTHSFLSMPVHAVIHLCLCLLLLTLLIPFLPLLKFVPPNLCPLNCVLTCTYLGPHSFICTFVCFYICLFGFHSYLSMLLLHSLGLVYICFRLVQLRIVTSIGKPTGSRSWLLPVQVW